MYCTVYRVTNNLTGKIYVGVHKTNNLDDDYMGSGKYLRRAQEKHGLENFEKEILFVFDNPEDMYAKEAEIVNEDFLSEENTYNIRLGGSGGFEYINSTRNHNLHNRKIALKRNYNEESYICRLKESIKKSFENGRVSRPMDPVIRQMGNSPEARQKARETQKKTFKEIGHQQGDKNSQYGTCWIFHVLIGSRKCRKELLPLYIEQGWIKGRNLYQEELAE